MKSSSKSTTSVSVPPPSAAEQKLTQAQLTLADQQLANLDQLGDFTSQVFQSFLPTLANEINKFLPEQQRITAETLGFAGDQIGAQGELLNRELEAIRQGVTLTPDQDKLITDSANAAIESGLSDINRYRDESLRSLAQETSIARGLRPEDTPILDVGGRIVNESSRQASQLISGIRSQEAQQRLQYPIDAGNYIAGRTQAQQTLGANTMSFIEQLRQQAFNNRLNLTAATGNLGVNTAGIGPSPNLVPAMIQARTAAATTTTKQSGGGGLGGFLSGLGTAAGGVGGLLTGMDAVGLGFAGSSGGLMGSLKGIGVF